MRVVKQGVRSLVFSLAAMLALSTTPVFAVENQGIGGRPANPRADNPRSNSIFVYELEPGASIKDAISVSNGTGVKTTVAVYATDSVVSSGGAFACEQKADEADKVGSWIKIESAEVEIEPQTSTEISFTLSVPDDAEVGEHNGCIAIQDRDQKPATDVNGIQLSFRSAIRVAVTVPGEIRKSLSIASIQPFNAKDTSKQGVRVVLKNDGNVSLDVDLHNSIASLSGQEQDAIKGTYALIAGNDTELNFEFKRPKWPGFYKVKVDATYNSDLDSFIGDEGEKSTISASTTIFVKPTTLQIALLILIIIVLSLLFKRWWYYKVLRRRYKRRAQPYTVKLREDLPMIARRFGVNWKQLAKLNGLKKPYNIHQGQVLYVPTARGKKYRLRQRRSIIRPRKRR